MPDITNATLPPKIRKKGTGTNRPKQLKPVTKFRSTITVDPIVWQKAKQKLGRKLSSTIEDFLRIIAKD